MTAKAFIRSLLILLATAAGFWTVGETLFGDYAWYERIGLSFVSLMLFQALFGKLALWYRRIENDPWRQNELKYVKIIGLPATIYDAVWQITQAPFWFLELSRGVRDLRDAVLYLIFSIKFRSFRRARTKLRPEIMFTYRLRRLRNRTLCGTGVRGALCSYRVWLATWICKHWVDSRDPGHCS